MDRLAPGRKRRPLSPRLVVVLVLLICTPILVRGFRTARETEALMAQGVVESGTVLTRTETPGGKSGPHYIVSYTFPMPNGAPDAIGGEDVGHTLFQQLSPGSRVDVVFVPKDPALSMLDLVFQVQARHPWRPFITSVWLSALVVGFGLLVRGFNNLRT